MKKTLLYTLPLLMMMAFVACSKDGKPTDIERPGDGEDTTRVVNSNFTFSVNLPAQANPNPKSNSGGDGGVSTYAISAQDENAVSTINVLAFKHNVVPDTYTLVDWAEATNIGDATGGTDGNKKTFKVKFSKLIKDSPYQFIIAANAKTEVAELFSTYGITFDAPKDATLALIKLTGVTEWVNTAGAAVRNFPMWGESETVAITENMSIDEVRLLRMVAKINVTVDNNVTVRSDFKLKSVDLYNFNKDGRVVPDAANLASGSKSKVVKPTTNERVHTQGPIPYASSSTEGLSETIYTFESKVPYLTAPNVDLGDVICIVVGGHYKGSSDMSYYRVDIAKKNTTTDLYDYMDILRNHNYKINITKVANNGYGSSLDAFNSRAVNIDVDIEAWDEDDVTVDYDGQYQFGTDKRHLEFFMEGRAQDILVFADHPNGWAVDMNTLPDWLTVTPEGDNSGSPKIMSVTATPLLATDPERVGEFYIIAHNLKKKITVKQMTVAEFSLEVTPENITFRKSAASPKSFNVKSFPAGLTYTLTYPTGGTNIVWEPGYEPPASSTLNSYTIKPAAITAGGDRATTITVSVTHPTSGAVISKTVNVHQYSTDIDFHVTLPASYPPEGGAASFTVRSAAMWQLNTTSLFVSNYSIAPQPIALTGVAYPFVLAGNTTYENRTITFNATAGDNETPDFPNQDIDIVQLHKAPYITGLDGTAATVDFAAVSTIKSVSFTTNTKWAVTATDANIAQVVASGYPAKGVVQTGSNGNALVGAKASFNLTPNTAYVGFPKAGDDVISSITLSTMAHAPALAAVKKLTLKRKVPAYWKYVSISPTTGATISANATSVTVTADTNMAWLVSATGTPNVGYPASAYAAGKTQAITITVNPAWKERTIVVAAIQAGGTALIRGTYTQAGSTLAYSAGLPATLAGVGGSFNIVFTRTGAALPFRVRAINKLKTVVLSSTSESSSSLSHTINIYMSDDSATREVIIQAYIDGGWADMKTVNQSRALGLILDYPGNPHGAHWLSWKDLSPTSSITLKEAIDFCISLNTTLGGSWRVIDNVDRGSIWGDWIYHTDSVYALEHSQITGTIWTTHVWPTSSGWRYGIRQRWFQEGDRLEHYAILSTKTYSVRCISKK